MARLVVSFHVLGNFVPFNYNYFLTSVLFQNLRELGSPTHDSPLCYTFSRLLLKDRRKVEGGFRASWATLVFSTPSMEVLTLLAEAVFI